MPVWDLSTASMEVLDWVKSYLSDRKWRIKIKGSLSDSLPLPCGVPQGSVLGPLLFTLYTSPLSSVISRFRVMHHFYADDTPIYLHLHTENCDSNLSELSHCLDAVQAWMGNSTLKSNPDKIKFILLGKSSARDELNSFFPSNLLGNEVIPTDEVKNLDVHFDSDLSFDTYIWHVCKSS